MHEMIHLSQYMIIILTALLGAFYAALPDLTRPALFFAVTVDPGFRRTRAGRAIVRGYRTVVLVVTAAGLLVAWRFGRGFQGTAGVGVMVGVLAVATGAFLWGRSRALPHAVAMPSVRQAVVAPRRVSLPGGPLAQAGPFLLMLATGGWLAASWERIPARFPVHWNASGVADAFASRSPATVFGPLLTNLLMCFVLLCLAVAISLSSRRIAVSGEQAASEGRFRRLVLLILLGAEYLVALMASLVAALPILGPRAERWTVPAVASLTLAFLAVAIFAMVRTGQGGSRAGGGEPAQAAGAAAGDGTEDRYWKLGLLYVNPEDPAIFVEKRFGFGYTLNFGNARAWLILALVLAPVAIVMALAMLVR
ncbi:MAG: DUF1648 domain-containing protein [Acidobacteria bacterium]|nr:DUF1648 domain-containing protein [Acidobacteriota bacterium]